MVESKCMNEGKSLLHPEHFIYTCINIGSYSTALKADSISFPNSV